MDTFKKLLILIFLSKKIFKKPLSKDILIVNKDLSDFPISYFKNTTECLDTRFHMRPNQDLNLYVLIKCIIKFKFSFFSYICEYIRCVNPKILLTLIDNDLLFYKLKKIFPDIQTIMIQNATRTLQDTDILSNIKKLKTLSLKVDYYFCFNEKIGSIFRSFLDCKVVPIGSFRSNFSRIKKSKKIYDFLFISSFRAHETIRKEEWIFFRNLEKYLISKKKKLYILGSTIKISDEVAYYKKMLRKIKFVIIERNNKRKTYDILDKSKIIINTESTAGYEALSRSNKVAFFNIRGNRIPFNSINFGWPYSFKKKGIFWTNKNNYKELKRVMDYLNNVSYQKFFTKSKTIREIVMKSDPGNKIVRSYIPKLIDQKS